MVEAQTSKPKCSEHVVPEAPPVTQAHSSDAIVRQILLRRIADVLARAAARRRRKCLRVVGALDGAALGPFSYPLACVDNNFLPRRGGRRPARTRQTP